MNGSEVMAFAVAIYLGFALAGFFSAISRDLITPVIAGIFPGVQASIDKITVQIGPVKLSIGDAIGAFVNLLIAYLVVAVSLPLVTSYAPLGGRR